MTAAIIMALALAASNAASPDAGAAAPRAIAGPWRLSVVGGKIGCTLALSDLESPGGLGLGAPVACQRAIPPLRDLSVWNLDARGGLVFSDPARRHVVWFSGPAGGPYAASAPDGRLWRLAIAAPRAPADLMPRT
jgi:hypothetical protein